MQDDQTAGMIAYPHFPYTRDGAHEPQQLACSLSIIFQLGRNEAEAPGNLMSKLQHRLNWCCKRALYAAQPLPDHDNRVAL